MCMRTMGIFWQFLEKRIQTKEGWIQKQEIRKNRMKYGKMVGVTQSEPEASEMAQKPVVCPIEQIPAYNAQNTYLLYAQSYRNFGTLDLSNLS